MSLVRSNRKTALVSALALGVVLAGAATYASCAAAQVPEKSEDSGKQNFAPLVSGGQIDVGESRPTDDKVEEAKDQLLLASKSAEVVQDGTTSWGSGGRPKFYFPAICRKELPDDKVES